MLASAPCRTIRVLIADDHEIVRMGLSRVLAAEPDIEVVGTAGDGAEAVAECAPDVVLMDVRMPRMDGIEATQRLGRTADGPRIVMLTSFSDREQIMQALDSGAVGYLLKDAESHELLRGVRAAADGGTPLAPRVAMTLVMERRNGAGAESLSDREREVLALVGAGVPNKQIALRLGISPKTVKSHLSNVFRRIGVRDRLQAAMWARRHGLVGDAEHVG
jgi:DNA-binding NarL/FixJ family response regulator